MSIAVVAAVIAAVATAVTAVVTAAAVAAPVPATELPRLLRQQPIVLLGEVHDNAAQHALRLAAFRALLASGARPALLLEQFDRERQPQIDAALANPAGATADTVIAAGNDGAAGWDWSFYRPFIELALTHRLPIVAANVSRADARKVIAGGLASLGFDPTVDAAVLQVQAASIVDHHCGLVDAAQAGRMALAQVARDRFMARMVEAHAARGAVLLAGNGHVRRDAGVPRWLTPQTRARTIAIGLLEEGDDDAAAYDSAVRTPRQPREDPCAGPRKPPS